tara:strand:- start:105 stop:515 length:411 start_codon:yes stop_codon:yes gene_type:complete
MEKLKNQYQKTRSDHLSETAEDYVEAIQEICSENGFCRIVDLAKHMQVSHVTVTKIIRRLTEENLVEKKPYGPLRLTKDGNLLAKLSQQRHVLVYEFLKSIGVNKRFALQDSEGIEHHCSMHTLKKMKRFIAKHKK